MPRSGRNRTPTPHRGPSFAETAHAHIRPTALDERHRFHRAFLDEVVPAAYADLHLDVGPAVVGRTRSRVAGEAPVGRFGVLDVDRHGWESAAGLEG